MRSPLPKTSLGCWQVIREQGKKRDFLKILRSKIDSLSKLRSCLCSNWNLLIYSLNYLFTGQVCISLVTFACSEQSAFSMKQQLPTEQKMPAKPSSKQRRMNLTNVMFPMAQAKKIWSANMLPAPSWWIQQSLPHQWGSASNTGSPRELLALRCMKNVLGNSNFHLRPYLGHSSGHELHGN